MAWFLKTEERDYVILDSSESGDISAVREFLDADEAVAFLREFQEDVFCMSALRHLAAERQSASEISGWDDGKIVKAVALELASGRLRIADEARREHSGGKPGEPPEPVEPVEPVPPEEPPKPQNIVTPHIAAEYKVVLLDKDLAKHQEASETKIVADVTRVEVWFTQNNGSIPYEKGATVSCAPANADVYRDEKCETKLKGDLTPEDIAGGKKLKLYLKGKTAGKFSAKITLKDPENGQILLADNPAQEEMGVVKLEFKLHQQDVTACAAIQVDPDTDPIATYHTNLKNKALPAQKEMTDKEKVKTGRLLHEKNVGHFSRAKLILKKLDAAEWPAGTDDYEICLNEKNTSGSAAVHGKEWDADLKAFPVKVKVSDLKAADMEFWVEGKSAVKKLREVMIDAGIDRAAGGLSKKAKRNGDWARFTVVKITEVKVDYTATAGKAVAWDSANNKFYINYKSDPDGRKITIGATLSEKLKDITIHFMLAEDRNNRLAANWGINLPSTWKWKNIAASVKHKDKANRKNLLHLSAKTDADGYAKKELQLSRFGGDQFRPGSYIEQDPHLAKYIDGHADLGKKQPVLAASALTVWRRFWYQLVKVQGITVPGLGVAVGQYSRVKTDMKACTDLSVTSATVNAYSPKAIYPRYMVRLNGGNGDALVVADTNKAQFFTGFAAETNKPIKIPILVCDAQWDAGGNSAAIGPISLPASAFPTDLTTDKLILTPPLQGGNLLVSGNWEAKTADGHGGWINVCHGTLTNGDLSVNSGRTNLHNVTVAVPAGAGVVSLDFTLITISNLVVRGADGPYLGESFNRRILAVYESDTALRRADFQNTIVHEVGHAFHQVISGNPAGGVAGIPRHPNQMDLGQGNHCRNLTDKCVMYDSGPIAGSLNRFCDVCHPYLLVQDKSSIV